MEKVIWTVAVAEGTDPAEVGRRAREELAPALAAEGARSVQVNAVDAHVAPAAGMRIRSSARPADLLVSVWVDSANDPLRAPLDALVSTLGGHDAAYLVTESVPLVQERPPEDATGRIEGMAQVAFLRRPEGLDVEDWRELWLGRHTAIAIRTQDTFAYVQNVVTRVLTPGAEPWDAIVEEGFPPAAMTDPHAFFASGGDDEVLAAHQGELFESVQRFVDLGRIDVLPTTRYELPGRHHLRG